MRFFTERLRRIPVAQFGFDAVCNALNSRELPPDFSERELKNAKDYEPYTIAHFAAYDNILPPWFDKWEIGRETGWSITHIAAINGNLPSDFEKSGNNSVAARPGTTAPAGLLR
ncbi:MAG: hypothetical protein LBP92_06230 [Deltaproteobacteria bacterium]|nr:hypothetical protein [Deltaproteobacteria bacterium]